MAPLSITSFYFSPSLALISIMVTIQHISMPKIQGFFYICKPGCQWIFSSCVHAQNTEFQNTDFRERSDWL